ncbi:MULTISPECIES: dipeptide ABC transporter ATP-binding protein [Paraburkholderia]|uniref:Glutathione import ATP-binding protein GsiA n=1 Tax=Paraburkholderia nemoris TaxID=2793076 RepID=A0ABM8SPJ0_9BURK|nr:MULTISPECIES: ABC transporter ATP-binding protein [Paraburkholderia]MBK5183308.1 ABC transporter ATP-binding protein [Burkholderia sp. R-69749]MBK3814801.1 ABC transporter ATP-binding protein [Paraburkholderia aspalathi]CAE6823408.1 Glutathione import ATP-binding protein GsiA [Paraburkholderia nemoris]CAE6836000.1 Glutathione import ATP-binding protein GsiA [Paraburkholderia nemoris]CAE6858535.1 Glutathione import ATP-binding protein GsiA [Paraburkholderia domus]
MNSATAFVPTAASAFAAAAQPASSAQPGIDARTRGEPVVRIENLTIAFRGRHATQAVLGPIDLTVHAGECLALVGESGSGKSVTARSLVGLNGANSEWRAERFEIAGKDARRYRERDWRAIRGNQIGYVLQDALVSLDPLWRVRDLVAEALRGVPSRDVRERSAELLQSVGIDDPERRLPQYPHQLSGGLRQRVLIGTAIAGGASLLIADEPTTALDMTVQRQILALLRARRDAGDALLLISHDLAVVAELADRVLVMRSGRVVEQGPTREVLSAPAHPYTRQLLAAIPVPASRGFRLATDTRSTDTPDSAERIPLPQKRIDAEARVLSVESVSKRYGTQPDAPAAVDEVSFTLAKGETLGIVGESGSGKSTVARIVLGLLAPDSGQVTLDGQPWSTLPEAARRRRRAGLQLIAQDPYSSFDPRYTVGQIIGESLDAVGIRGDARRRRVLQLLDEVRLGAGCYDRTPRELSGGQRQRVAIARAFAPNPALLVADEPVSALDVSIQAQVLDLLADLQAEHGTAMLFISHDLGVVHHVADRIIVMRHGRVVETGPVERVFNAPAHPYTASLLDALPSLPERAPHAALAALG